MVNPVRNMTVFLKLSVYDYHITISSDYHVTIAPQ